MENIKRIAKLLLAAVMAFMVPAGALAEEMNFVQKFIQTGKITVLGMCGIFVVMIIVYLVITILNKTTK